MVLKRLMNGMLSSNCYIIGDSSEGAVIDPGVDYEDIARTLEEQKLSLKYIILTHAHIDHIVHMKELKDKCGGSIVLHEEDGEMIGDADLNGASYFGLDAVTCQADMLVKDGDKLKLGDLELEIIHTPGHSSGSMCIKIGENLFTGDTLFRLGMGRTDLGTGDIEQMMKSLAKLMQLDDGVKVYPGHGAKTDIGFERAHNKFIGH